MVYKIKTVKQISDINWDEVPKAMIDKIMWVHTDNNPKAYAQMVFIENQGFLCLMTAFEKNPKAIWTNDNDPICDDSTLEAYFMFDKERYLNLETNSKGARKQAIRYNRENKTYIYNNEFKGFRVTPRIYEDRWTILIEIPLDNLLKLYTNLNREMFKSGFTFTGNFYKVHELRGTPLEHYIAWQEIKNPFPECHLKEQFGTLVIE